MREKNFKIIGWILVAIGIFFNPFIIEWLFSPDGKLDFLWKYIVIAILDCLLIATGIIVTKPHLRKRVFNKNRIWIKVLAIIIIIIIIIIVLEITCHVLLEKENIKFISDGDFIVANKEMGYAAIPSISVRMAKLVGDKLVYNATYSVDDKGRRVNQHNNQEPLILFGGSFVSGDGLEDNETLNHYLSEFQTYDVYNYAFSGYGTQHTLAHLEREDIFSEINKTGGVAIYIFIPNHIKRVIGDMFWSYTSSVSPYYYLEDEEVIRKGSFETGRPLTTKFYKTLMFSNIIKFLDIHGEGIPRHKKKHTYLTFKIIEKSKKIYEEKFDGKFYVFFHPLEHNLANYNTIFAVELKEMLQEHNISFLEFDLVNQGNYEEFHIPNDPHPNTKLNKILAEKIILELE
ncbi:hypothetical protein ISS04_04380 [Candidatus Woesearchaeota archaeon]|nr:hypothetical protein [Candidatus Woesearchaeota archaeon]